ncbi:MAG: LptF/LptG family permease [Elusimicrobia bacterium]|nr:LptF/LptG family permease [Elusimicrobiota bacterium]MDE2312956.1 LptF/LptG family permease [Elusimicrobiota bacterium]
MGIMSRYLVRLFLPVFLAALGVFLGILLMNQFLRLFALAMTKGVSIFWILSCFTRLLPFLLSLAIPMAYVVALFLVLGQLSENSEIMALRACGFSFLETTWPFLAAAVALSGVLFYLNHKAGPDGFHAFRGQYDKAAAQISRVVLEPDSFTGVGPWRLLAKGVDRRTGALRGVYLAQTSGANAGLEIRAKTGRLWIDKGRAVHLELDDGVLQLPNPDPAKYTAGRFDSDRIDVPLAAAPAPRERDIPEIPSAMLRSLIRDPKTSPQHHIEYTVELAVRSAAAMSPLIFFWIAAPMGFALGRRGRAANFAFSLGLLFAYYGLIALGIGLGRRHGALASFAPWMADAAGAAFGAGMTRRAFKI